MTDEIKLTVIPKNYSYILAYFTSIFNKMKKAKIDNIPLIIDSLIDKEMFEIQLYHKKNELLMYDAKSKCSRCHKDSPINSTFCSNCNMIKLLYDSNNLSRLLQIYKKGRSSYHIMVEVHPVYKAQYECITSEFTSYIKTILMNMYKGE